MQVYRRDYRMQVYLYPTVTAPPLRVESRTPIPQRDIGRGNGQNGQVYVDLIDQWEQVAHGELVLH